jgi:hypothetical protein
VDPKLHTDGYCSHPAVVDSCLHLGASLAQLSATTTDTIRVPVGVEAFTAGQQFKPHHAELHAACQLVSMPVGPGPAITSYSLQQAPAAPAAVSISKLEARPIKLPAASKLRLFPALAAPAAAKQQAPAADAAEPPLLYQVRWEADSRAGQYSSGQQQRQLSAASMALAVGKSGSRAAAQQQIIPADSSSSSGDAVWLLACLLARVQQAVRSGTAGSRISLATHGAMHAASSLAAPASSVAAAAAWGMLRVAASEAPEAKWAAVDLDSLAADSQLAAGEAADVSGSLVRHGLALRPMLLPSLADRAVPQSTETPAALSGRVLVPGGLGGECGGRLAGQWLCPVLALTSKQASKRESLLL